MKSSIILERLRSERLSIGWSLADVSRHLKTSQCYVSNVERGKIMPSLDFVCRYADILGIPLTLSSNIDFDLIVSP